MIKFNVTKTIPPKKNRGTGAGGHKTNSNGLPFEKITDLSSKYKVIEANKFSNIITFNDDIIQSKFINTEKSKFYKFMKQNHYVNNNIKPLHGAKQPDEVLINDKTKTIFIIEKKFQEVSGSKCECIQTGVNKRRNYQRRLPDFRIVYIYCLSKWFMNHCESEINDLKEDNIPVFWGDSDTYKEEIIKFITNYK